MLAASIVLVAFLGATGWALDRAFQDSARAAVHERLQAHVFTLLAVANLTGVGAMLLPDELPQPRFSRPGSGLYGWVLGAAMRDGGETDQGRGGLERGL